VQCFWTEPNCFQPNNLADGDIIEFWTFGLIRLNLVTMIIMAISKGKGKDVAEKLACYFCYVPK
jgi:hypothetical protein